jgi:hypothetical protein
MFRALVILCSLVNASAFAPMGRTNMRSSLKVRETVIFRVAPEDGQYQPPHLNLTNITFHALYRIKTFWKIAYVLALSH